MKKILLVATVLLSVNASANLHKVCAFKAQSVCGELENREDFYACYYSTLNWCLEDMGLNTSDKSIPGCFEQCSFIANENQRKLCYETCTEK